MLQQPPPVRPIPRRVRVFQLSTMMGLVILLAALIIGIVLATGVVPSYWNHSIANELNPAQPGSQLLSQLAIVSSFPKVARSAGHGGHSFSVQRDHHRADSDHRHAAHAGWNAGQFLAAGETLVRGFQPQKKRNAVVSRRHEDEQHTGLACGRLRGKYHAACR